MAFYGTQMQRTTTDIIPGTIDPNSADPRPLEQRIIDFNRDIIVDPTVITETHGLFTIIQAGTFYVSWFITLKTGLGEGGPCFSLCVLHTGETTHKEYPSTNSMKTGQIAGSAILEVAEGQQCELGLYNMGAYEAILATNTPVTANIVIHPYQVKPYTTTYGLVGMTLTLNDPAVSSLAYNAPIPFNARTPATSEKFSYDETTSTLTIKVSGNYLFAWSVNLEGSQNASAISFSLKSGTQTISTFDSTLIMQHPYSGFAFITATATNTFQLVNTSVDSSTTGSPGAALTFSTTPIKATMLIMGHS